MDRLNVLIKLWSPESNLKIKRMKCVAMEGLIDEANEVIESTEKTKCVMPH